MDALRSVVQPITHNLPGPIRDLGVSLIGDVCYKTLLLDVDFTDADCLKLAISKGLGIGIVTMSSVVKVPQILKLLSSKSAAGVSFLAYLLETSAVLVALAYNFRNEFPFSTYGETAMIAVQNIVISTLVLNYSGKSAQAALFVAGLAAAVAALFTESIVSMPTLKILQASGGVLGVASKIPQIVAIFQQGGTGQLSAFAVSAHTHITNTPSRHRSVLRSKLDTNRSFGTGLQLPPRLALPHLHDPARGGRSSDPVLLRGGLRAERCDRRADGLLLERAIPEGQGQAEGGARRGRWLLHGDPDQEGPDHATTRLSEGEACLVSLATLGGVLCR